ncbi:MAG: putative porin [Fimbriimonadaceae bacterium]|nr:putative porin [Fimbriimonadaceae bacterium]
MRTHASGLTRLLSGAALLLTCGLSWADTGTTPVQAAGGGAAAEEYVKKSDLGFQWTGDARLRIDARDRSDMTADPRFRLRLRAGAKGAFANGKGGWGFQLATNPGDPVSKNVTLGGGDVNGGGGVIGVDLAYFTFKPHADVALTLGKMANPFWTGTGIFDPDLHPEGAAVAWSPFQGGKGDLLKNITLKGGLFAIREFGALSADPYNASVQLTGDIGPVSTGIGLYYYSGLNAGNPFGAAAINGGAQAVNQLVGGAFPSDNMAVVAGRASYPFQIRSFPLTIHGEAAYNTVENTQNFMYEVGVSMPQIWKGSARLVYRDSGQFSAFSPWADTELGEGTGYHSGIMASYTRPLVKGVDVTATYYHYDRFQPISGAAARTTNRFQLDLSTSF